MKKGLILAGMLLASTSVFAQFTGDTNNNQMNGGFQGPSTPATTVERAKELRDDSYVMLEGQVTQHLGKEKYIFKDKTGEITVEIDHDKWRGVTVTPTDTVIIQGEIDRDWNSIEVDVDNIAKK